MSILRTTGPANAWTSYTRKPSASGSCPTAPNLTASSANIPDRASRLLHHRQQPHRNQKQSKIWIILFILFYCILILDTAYFYVSIEDRADNIWPNIMKFTAKKMLF